MTRARGRRVMSETTTDVNETGDFETQEVDYYNNHEGLRGRDRNVMYLDIAERIHGAENAAALRGEKADLTDLGKLPVTAGTPLVTRANLGDNVMSHPSTPLLENAGVLNGTDPVVTATVPVEPTVPFLSETAAPDEAPAEATAPPSDSTPSPTYAASATDSSSLTSSSTTV